MFVTCDCCVRSTREVWRISLEGEFEKREEPFHSLKSEVATICDHTFGFAMRINNSGVTYFGGLCIPLRFAVLLDLAHW